MTKHTDATETLHWTKRTSKRLSGIVHVCLSAVLFAPGVAFAQPSAFPSKPITIIVAFAPGQGGDVMARLLADALSKKWDKGVVVENRVGGGGLVASQSAVRAPADGHTLFLGSSGPMAILPHLNAAAGYDPRRDFTPIMAAAVVPMVLIVPVDSPFKSAADLVKFAKSSPGKLNYGSSGSGSTQHLTMELFKQRAGIDITHIPYKGGAPALTDLAGGRLDAVFETLATASPFLSGGKVRPLAVATLQRYDALPDTPTLSEGALPGFEALAWHGVVAPAGLSQQVRDTLNESLNGALKTDAVKDIMKRLGMIPLGGSSAEFKGFIAKEYDQWGSVIRSGNIKAD